MAGYNIGFDPQCEAGPTSYDGGIAMSQNIDTVPGFTSTGPFFGGIWPSSINQLFDSSSQYGVGLGNAVGIPPTQKFPALDFRNNIMESQWVNNQQSCQNHYGSDKVKSISPLLLCNWPGCKRPGPFCNKGTLKRHENTQHLAPRSFKCYHARCTMSFNRKDNLKQHLRSGIHWKI